MATTVAPTPAAPATPSTPATPATPAPSPTTPATPPTPPASVSSPYADARKAMAGQSWADVQFPGMATTDGTEPETPEPTPEAPAPVAEASAGAGEGPEFVQASDGSWHRADGTFATAEELAQIQAQLSAEAPPSPEPAAEPDAPAEPNPEHIVTLRRRDGTTREAVIEDPELAQEIRQNMNDGMRRREFTEQMAAVQAKAEKLNRLDDFVQTNPEAFVRETMNPQQQVNLAVMLLAQHFDTLAPIIQSYSENPSLRVQDTAQAQLRMQQQTAAFQQQSALRERVADTSKAITAMIPETASDEDATAFYQDAIRDIEDALRRGDRVDGSSIQSLLAPRLARYGFSATPAAAPARPRITLVSQPPAAPTVATPANDAAQQLAAARTAQTRLRLRQTQRTHAAAIPPAGAGAAPVRMPLITPGADLKQASKELRALGGTWHAPT